LTVAEYMRSAAPSATAGTKQPTTLVPCKRVCIKAGRGTPTHEAPCLEWKTVC